MTADPSVRAFSEGLCDAPGGVCTLFVSGCAHQTCPRHAHLGQAGSRDGGGGGGDTAHGTVYLYCSGPSTSCSAGHLQVEAVPASRGREKDGPIERRAGSLVVTAAERKKHFPLAPGSLKSRARSPRCPPLCKLTVTAHQRPGLCSPQLVKQRTGLMSLSSAL